MAALAADGLFWHRALQHKRRADGDTMLPYLWPCNSVSVQTARLPLVRISALLSRGEALAEYIGL